MTDLSIIIAGLAAVGVYAAIRRGLETYTHPMRVALVHDFTCKARSGDLEEDEVRDLAFMLGLVNSALAAWAILLSTPVAIVIAIWQVATGKTHDDARGGPSSLPGRAILLTLANSPMAFFLFFVAVFISTAAVTPAIIFKEMSAILARRGGALSYLIIRPA